MLPLCTLPRRLSARHCLVLMLAGLGVCGLGLPARVCAAPQTVMNLADDGTPGTLRTTLAAAQPGDTVMFGPNVTGTITLTQGELLLNKSVTITGPTAGAGATSLTIDGGGAGRVFHQTAGTVAISGLTVTNGSVAGSGGGLLVDGGSLTLTGCTVSGNTASVGGGLEFGGTAVTLTGCIFSSNSSAQDGGGVYATAGAGVTAAGCTFGGNTAQTDGGGLWTAAGVVPSLSGCSFDSNQAYGGFGAGLFANGGATANSCTFTNNFSGGSVAATGRTSGGGGITSAGGGRLTLTACTASGNQAETGGGVYTNGPLTITACTISGNTATGNGMNGGGGMVADASASGMLINCTVANNSALAGDGGGLLLHTALILTNCTVTANTAANGAGGGAAADAPSGPIMQAMLIAANTAASAPDIRGTFASSGSNLIGDGTGGSGLTGIDQVGTAAAPINAMLGTASS